MSNEMIKLQNELHELEGFFILYTKLNIDEPYFDEEALMMLKAIATQRFLIEEQLDRESSYETEDVQ